MQIAMMRSAQRDGKLVADLARQGAALRKLQVVRIRGAARTNETGLGADELQVVPIPHSERLPDRRHRLVGDALGRSIFSLCGTRGPGPEGMLRSGEGRDP